MSYYEEADYLKFLQDIVCYNRVNYNLNHDTQFYNYYECLRILKRIENKEELKTLVSDAYVVLKNNKHRVKELTFINRILKKWRIR